MLIQTPIAGFDLPLVTTLAAFIALPVKVLVDIVKGAFPRLQPAYLPPIGLLTGFAFSNLVLVATKTPIDSAVVAQCGIAAIMAQVGAMAVTAIQTRANRVDETIDKALKAEPGTTRVELDAAVKREASK